MEIQLDETYLIKTDTYNFKVGYYTEREKKREGRESIQYRRVLY